MRSIHCRAEKKRKAEKERKLRGSIRGVVRMTTEEEKDGWEVLKVMLASRRKAKKAKEE